VDLCASPARLKRQIESRFALFETRNIDGVSKLSYVGRYEDRAVKGEDGRWRIASRRVVLDTFSFRSLVIPL
jgi:3-phenylpropionate/cinnamic acid dioxygenase small subunit